MNSMDSYSAKVKSHNSSSSSSGGVINYNGQILIYPHKENSTSLKLQEEFVNKLFKLARQSCSTTDARSLESYKCALIAKPYIDHENNSISLVIDRSEPLVAPYSLPDSIRIPSSFVYNGDERVSESNQLDYFSSRVEQLTRFYLDQCSQLESSISRVLSANSIINYDNSWLDMNQPHFNVHISFDMATLSNKFEANRIYPNYELVYASTLKSLFNAVQDPLSSSTSKFSHGNKLKTGYCAFNKNNQLLLVTENDSLNDLPLAGIWVSGVSSVDNMITWTACVRYAFSNLLKNKKSYESTSSFLVVLISPSSNIEYFNCWPKDSKLEFTLFNGYSHLLVNKTNSPKNDIVIELRELTNGPKHQLFHINMRDIDLYQSYLHNHIYEASSHRINKEGNIMLNQHGKQYSSSSSSISSISSSSNYYSSGQAAKQTTSTRMIGGGGEPIDIYAQNIHSISPSPQIRPQPMPHQPANLTGSYHSVSDLSALSSSDAESDDHHHIRMSHSRKAVNSNSRHTDEQTSGTRHRILSNSENFEFVKPRDPVGMSQSPLSNSYDQKQKSNQSDYYTSNSFHSHPVSVYQSSRVETMSSATRSLLDQNNSSFDYADKGQSIMMGVPRKTKPNPTPMPDSAIGLSSQFSDLTLTNYPDSSSLYDNSPKNLMPPPSSLPMRQQAPMSYQAPQQQQQQSLMPKHLMNPNSSVELQTASNNLRPIIKNKTQPVPYQEPAKQTKTVSISKADSPMLNNQNDRPQLINTSPHFNYPQYNQHQQMGHHMPQTLPTNQMQYYPNNYYPLPSNPQPQTLPPSIHKQIHPQHLPAQATATAPLPQQPPSRPVSSVSSSYSASSANQSGHSSSSSSSSFSNSHNNIQMMNYHKPVSSPHMIPNDQQIQDPSYLLMQHQQKQDMMLHHSNNTSRASMIPPTPQMAPNQAINNYYPSYSPQYDQQMIKPSTYQTPTTIMMMQQAPVNQPSSIMSSNTSQVKENRSQQFSKTSDLYCASASSNFSSSASSSALKSSSSSSMLTNNMYTNATNRPVNNSSINNQAKTEPLKKSVSSEIDYEEYVDDEDDDSNDDDDDDDEPIHRGSDHIEMLMQQSKELSMQIKASNSKNNGLIGGEASLTVYLNKADAKNKISSAKAKKQEKSIFNIAESTINPYNSSLGYSLANIDNTNYNTTYSPTMNENSIMNSDHTSRMLNYCDSASNQSFHSSVYADNNDGDRWIFQKPPGAYGSVIANMPIHQEEEENDDDDDDDDDDDSGDDNEDRVINVEELKQMPKLV